MSKFAELNQFEIISSHQAAAKAFRMRLKLRDVPKRHIPKGVTLKQIEVYVKFALALTEREFDIDFVKIKNLVAYKKDNNWRFKCKVKEGLFKNQIYDFEWQDNEEDDY